MMPKVRSIRWKISFSYLVYILLFLLFVGILSNLIIREQFKIYAKNRQNNHIKHILSEISNQYVESWNIKNIELIGKHEIDNGYIISVYDKNKEIVWRALDENHLHCIMVLEEIKGRMFSHHANWNGELITEKFDLFVNDEKVGTLELSYIGPYFYTEEDFNFLLKLNTVYIASSIVFIFIALITAAYMAKRLSNPLRNIAKATENISRGIYQLLPDDKTNISEIKQLTNAINSLINSLKQQELLRKQLTQDVSHELRTPLSTLQSHIEAMIDKVLPIDNEQLHSIYEEIIRLNSLVDALSNLMYYDEKIELNLEYVNISDVIKRVVDLMKVQFINKDVNLKLNLENVYTEVDKDKMYQVFINILTNSLKYTEKGHIEISVINEKKQVKVIIKDTGIGISEKDLPHIFERLYRIDQSRNRKTGGVGIGLAIVKSIITHHNGTIIADSKIGEGTIITITLPKRKEI